MAQRPPNLILGVGNVLQRDDGVGVYAAQRMAALPLPPTVEVCDGGTLGLDLAGLIERRERVIVIEALEAGAEPGAIFRFTANQLRPCLNTGLSLHEAHVLDALDETVLLGTSPKRLLILAVQIADTSIGLGLSRPVQRALDRVVEQAAAELGLALESVHQTVIGVPAGCEQKGVIV